MSLKHWSYFGPERLWTKILPAISVNKECCGHQATTLHPPKGEPWGNSGRQQDATATATHESALWDLRWEGTAYWPQTSEACSKGTALTLHPSIHRKALNSLTVDTWSFINSILLMFQLPGLYCKISYICWLPSLTLWSSLSKSS